MRSPTPQRISIERIDLDLRGIDPALAETAARLLGAALRAQFAQWRSGVAPAQRIDAGSVAAAPDAATLAARLAQRIAAASAEREA